jgi:hypothetical protein
MSDRTLTYLPLKSLRPDPANPKAHSLGTIQDSVNRFGYLEPIVVDERTGFIISGHGRTEALTSAWAENQTPPEGVTVADDGGWLVPVVTGWSSRNDAEARGALIALNRTTELGGWQDDVLLDLLSELALTDDGFTGIGYDDDSLTELRKRLASTEKDSPWDNRAKQGRPAEGDILFGDIYRVGEHVVAVGDSRDPALWDRLATLWVTPPTLLFTDPPYGIDYSGGGGVEREALDGDTADDAAPLLRDVLNALRPHIAPGAASYICVPSGPQLLPLLQVASDAEVFRWALIWAKHNATFGRADYHAQHEVILYGWFPGGAHHPVADRKQTTLWEIPRPSKSSIHPTEKPIELAARAIRNSTDPGDLVVDTFGGSLSTALAAHQEGRPSVSVEFYPGYVAEAMARLAAVTAETPELIHRN